MGEERPWEKSYPPGVRWDALIETAPLPVLFDAFTEARTGMTHALVCMPSASSPRRPTDMTPMRDLRRETLR